jgi:hypothetical protein
MNIYKLYLNSKKQVTGYSKIDKKEKNDIVFGDKDLELVGSYMTLNVEAEFTEIQEIKEWLLANDYKINKHTLGEYTNTDTRWTTYLEERKTKLARYNELEVIVNNAELPVFNTSLLSPVEGV